MSVKLNIEPRVRSLVSYLSDIEAGIVQIPAFQRDYVWDRDDIKDLFDSIKNRYPIGSILFWKPDITIGVNKKTIGSYYIPQFAKESIYILDGFQRLSTLFGCLTNPNKSSLTKDSKEWETFFKLYYDLEEETFIYVRAKTQAQPFQVPVYVLMNSSDFRQFARREFEKIHNEDKIEKYYDKADNISRALLDYQIASIDINNATIEEAVEIFSRVNSKGEEISFDWMANALSIKEGFRFGDEIDGVIEDLKKYNFDGIDRNVIFRCIQSSFGKLYIDNPKIEVLAKRPDFSKVTRETLPKILEAVKFLFEELLVLDNKLLPYNIQLIFIMDFFKRFSNPTDEQKGKLKDWFWITTYSNYFTIYSLANQRRAYEHFHQYLDGFIEFPVYNDKPNLKFTTTEFPEKMTMGSVRAKALTLFLLNTSNDFNSVNSNEVLAYKMQKIYTLNSNAENFVPIVQFSAKEFDNENWKLYKNKNLSYLLEQKFDSFENRKFFITNEMYFNQSESSNLNIRKGLIQRAEQQFVENLGMEYLID